MFELTRPTSKGLVSVAPKKATPTIVVNQSKKPTNTSAEKNNQLFFYHGSSSLVVYNILLQTHTYPSRMVKNTTVVHMRRHFNSFM
jgi:hypothetical protein